MRDFILKFAIVSALALGTAHGADKLDRFGGYKAKSFKATGFFRTEHDGKRWVYNSVRQWHADNFPFWSVVTVKRILANLEGMGLVEVANLNTNAYDRTHGK